jgi:hypothetical protein
VKEIIYVGMTNGVSGLAGRLKQFDATIKAGPPRHGGADRMKRRHPDYRKLTPSLYLALAPFDCNPRTNRHRDLQMMGEVAKFDYSCLAEYEKAHGCLPEFNDKKASPKYSRL